MTFFMSTAAVFLVIDGNVFFFFLAIVVTSVKPTQILTSCYASAPLLTGPFSNTCCFL